MRLWRAFIVAILLGLVTMTPAHSDTVYAYWSYWQGDTGTWKYALVGPATSPAIDGAVDGWRFTLGSDGKATRPVLAPDFASICGATAKPDNAVRVAVIVDNGSATTAVPTSYCSVVETGLTRMSALGAVAELRLNNGFICGVNGVPESGCGDAVDVPISPAVASASVTPTRTATAPSASASTVSLGPIESTTDTAPTVASAEPSASPSPSVPADRDTGSPLSTIITMILAAITMALALRNARRQRESR